MHWYIPIPTSNIRLLCLTYTFSPCIRLIRLFWKKWKRKGKVRDTVLKGYKMLFLHISSQRIDNNMLREVNTSNIDTWATSGPFVSVPVPLDLRPPLDPTASMRKIGKQHLTHSYDRKLYKNWWEEHTRLKSYFLYVKGLRRSRHTGWLCMVLVTQSKPPLFKFVICEWRSVKHFPFIDTGALHLHRSLFREQQLDLLTEITAGLGPNGNSELLEVHNSRV